MQHNSLLICQRCKQMLYSHIDLSKTMNDVIQSGQRDENCSLIAEAGFKSKAFVCDECLQIVLHKMEDYEDFERYHTTKWNELTEEIENIKEDIDNIDVILQGYENTKENEESVKRLRELKEQSFEQLNELLKEIDKFDIKCTESIEKQYWTINNKLLKDLQQSTDEQLELSNTIALLKDELQTIEKRSIFGSLFEVESFSDGSVTLCGIPFKYSIEKVNEFNIAMGKLVLGIYLMGKKIIPKHSTIPIPFDDHSQISVQIGQKKNVYNLFIQNQSFYSEADESFKEGFKHLIYYFSDLYEKCSDIWPKLKEKYHYEIKPTTMCVFDTKLNKSYLLIFDRTKIEQWNKAIVGLLKLFNYLSINFDRLLDIIEKTSVIVAQENE
ncbi:hypothetical protein ENUP19_0057G0074 [Entamoeba nuttalli]|uniref:Atg6 BARA domain-containing protein n=2 Tax=Entamoeba nuttalli TaxID=412467 RepID=K2HDG1_ENTNP|nr:hypothetical protein ENU1_078280 [Entamoeba nuttalli P19]EKE40829.1 hypothetical protein ENU1_078280 [Entamoeba nuttalli P19]|eukprot:XP_008856839.1 hypothetical protein ENU1_078280 [Entamoeba nuttalli P19]